jgi:hypothetical protein
MLLYDVPSVAELGFLTLIVWTDKTSTQTAKPRSLSITKGASASFWATGGI